MISSLDNKKVKQWRKLHQKKYREDTYLLLDQDLIKFAKEKGYLDYLVYVGKKPFEFERCEEVSREVLDKIAMKEGLDYLGIGKMIKESNDYQERVIILDHLQDPLNIGRILESAVLFGFDSVLISDESADLYNEKCLVNSKGALYLLNIYHGDLKTEIKVLKEKGFKVYSTGLRANTKELYATQNRGKIAIVLGNEGSGVTSEIMDISDEIIKIDMHNIDSLNVAMAGAIVMYHFKI